MKIGKNGIIDIRESFLDERASILICGDFCPRGKGEALILDGKAESIVEPIQDVVCGNDLSIIQFETVLTEEGTPIVKSGPNLKSKPGVIEMLHALGTDVALMANNHTGDYGPEALLETKALLEEQGFKTVGAGSNLEEAYKPLIIDVGDFEVGIFNVCENEFGGATKTAAGSATLEPGRNVSQIYELASTVDFCLVITHGGNEEYPLPSPRVAAMSRAFIDAGADAVINMHTHCPQGIELYKEKPIVYSLGNFYFPKPSDAPTDGKSFWNLGYMVRLQIDFDGVFALEPIPVQFAMDGSTMALLQDKQLKGFYKYLQKISDLIIDEDKLVRYYEAWASKSPYAKMFKEFPFPKEVFVPHNEQFCHLRNLLTCEAHNEILRTYLRLVEDGRLANAEKDFHLVEKLMTPDFLV